MSGERKGDERRGEGRGGEGRGNPSGHIVPLRGRGVGGSSGEGVLRHCVSTFVPKV